MRRLGLHYLSYSVALAISLTTALLGLLMKVQGETERRGSRAEVLVILVQHKQLKEPNSIQFVKIKISQRGRIARWKFSDGGALVFDASGDKPLLRSRRADGTVVTKTFKGVPAGVKGEHVEMALLTQFTLPNVPQTKVGEDELLGEPCDIYYAKFRDRRVGVVKIRLWSSHRSTLRLILTADSRLFIWETLNIERDVVIPDDELSLSGD